MGRFNIASLTCKLHPYLTPASFSPIIRSQQLCYLVHPSTATKNPCYFAGLYHLLIVTLLRRKGSDKRIFTVLKLHILHLQSRPSTYCNAFAEDSCTAKIWILNSHFTIPTLETVFLREMDKQFLGNSALLTFEKDTNDNIKKVMTAFGNVLR